MRSGFRSTGHMTGARVTTRCRESRFMQNLSARDWQVTEQARGWVDPDHATPGGSTLATQIEKYRDTEGGRTGSARGITAP